VNARNVETLIREKEAHRLARFSLDHANDIVFWALADGRVMDVNQRAETALGHSREVLTRLTTTQLASLQGDLAWNLLWQKLQLKGSVVFEAALRRSDGALLPTEFSVFGFQFEGIDYACVFARDISERLKIEEDRRRLMQRMQQSQKLEGLGTLAGGIAHDFNNLLMVITGNAYLGQEEVEREDSAYKRFQAVIEAADRAADLCRQMLAYAGKAPARFESLSTNETIAGMVGLLRTLVGKRARLDIHLDARNPFIRGDRTQVQQVLLAIVTNSLEACSEMNGEIGVMTGIVELSRADFEAIDFEEPPTEGMFAFIEVSDNGCGMTDEQRHRIFDPFFTTKFQGRGLGLAAVAGIVRAHRGGRQVKSRPGEGT
ncbi:MAG TPA: ATP-binding protein, partial [Candidatus Ozemobacteraceae bacterium]|nr:ATP-binding protein [Candidatus Ozemobacteraceae bacterium]